jgi:LPXTG-motif cell wall-anchored protein
VLEFSDGEINNNTAVKNGGGIAMFILDKCTGYEYSSDGAPIKKVSTPKSTAIISGESRVENNEARNGGGFYVGSGELTVTGGYLVNNYAKGTPASTVTTATVPNDNVGVGGGVYVYSTGTFIFRPDSKTDIGLYDNEADFAADDIYCSPVDGSDVTIPAVKDMNLKDEEGNMLGKVQDWYEDYPNGDSDYTSRAVSDANGIIFIDENDRNVSSTLQIIRYDLAVENLNKIGAEAAAVSDDDDEETTTTTTSRYNANSTHTVPILLTQESTITGYLCADLGLTETRSSLTIGEEYIVNHVTQSTGGPFTFTVTIEGAVSSAEYEQATDKSTVNTHVGEFSADDIAKYNIQVLESTPDVYTVASDGKVTVTENGSVKLSFSLNAGESLTLSKIPTDAQITIVESGVDSYVNTATNNTTNHSTEGDTLSVKLTTDMDVTFTNETGFTLPSTGGSGTLIYTFGGLILTAAAVVCWNLRRRRAS